MGERPAPSWWWWGGPLYFFQAAGGLAFGHSIRIPVKYVHEFRQQYFYAIVITPFSGTLQ
jgi:hypothetical protein